MTPASSLSDPLRITTGVAGLDEVLGGGLTRDRVYLVEGSPGTGKTTLSLQFLLDGAARGEAGFGDLAADCAARLRVRLARPQRASGDWSVELPAGTCGCSGCTTPPTTTSTSICSTPSGGGPAST